LTLLHKLFFYGCESFAHRDTVSASYRVFSGPGKGLKMNLEKFLTPTPYIDFDNPLVRGKSLELVYGATTQRDKAIRIFYAVRDGIRYTIYGKRSLPEHFRASDVLSAREGYCVQKAILLVALARSVSIPARLRFAAIRNHLMPAELLEKRGTNFFPYHGYTDLLLEGSWVKAAPTFDMVCCQNAGLRPVDFDGAHDALLPSFTLDGRRHIEYVEDRGVFDHVPYDEIMEASLRNKYLSTSLRTGELSP
jgi:transglutaminase-like putative cysteine protease